MKILRVVGDIYPDVVGGLEIHAHELSKMQAKLGHTVMVFTSDTNNLPKEEFKDGYTIIRYFRIMKLFGNSISLDFFTRLMKNRYKYDIIHAHSHLFMSTNVCAFMRLIGSSPLVITHHGLMSASASVWLNTLYLKTIGRWTLNCADKIICYTDEEKARLRSFLNIDERKIVVIPNGVNTDLFCPDKNALRSSSPTILWVGRFVPGKGVNVLIDAFYLVNKHFPDARLLLVGDGPLRECITKQIENSGLTNSVRIFVHVDNAKLPEVYNESDIFVLPSLMEGVPRTILEAMACGKPVIITEFPHLEKIIEGAGLFTPPGDPVSLSKNIIRLLNDREFASNLGVQGRLKIVEQFSWHDTVEKTLTVYKSLL